MIRALRVECAALIVAWCMQALRVTGAFTVVSFAGSLDVATASNPPASSNLSASSSSPLPDFKRQAQQYLRGSELTPEAVAKLEEVSQLAPSDVDVRLLLAAYYYKHRRDVAHTAKWVSLVEWLVTNHPGHPDLQAPWFHLDPAEQRQDYSRIAGAWIQCYRTDPSRSAVLLNAASFFSLSMPMLSKELFYLAGVSPSDARVGPYLHAAITDTETIDKELSKRKLESQLNLLRQCVYLASGSLLRAMNYSELGKTALALDDRHSAEESARAIIRELSSTQLGKDLIYPIHCAYTILGLIAERNGDVSEAAKCLQLSVSLPTEARFLAWSPTFALAARLLALGRRSDVVQYLIACHQLWPAGSKRLDEWIEHIRNNDDVRLSEDHVSVYAPFL